MWLTTTQSIKYSGKVVGDTKIVKSWLSDTPERTHFLQCVPKREVRTMHCAA